MTSSRQSDDIECETFGFINHISPLAIQTEHFLPSSEPDSSPTNITLVDTSPSTITLAWSAPEKANGVILYYEVLYRNESYSASMNTSSNRITLTNLKPFSHYNVSVRAYTRYGHGNQTSDTLYLLSGEDGVLMDTAACEYTHVKAFGNYINTFLCCLCSSRQSSVWPNF